MLSCKGKRDFKSYGYLLQCCLSVFLVVNVKIVEIVRTFGIDTFVYAKEPAVFLGNQGIAAMRTCKPEGSGDHFAG